MGVPLFRCLAFVAAFYSTHISGVQVQNCLDRNQLEAHNHAHVLRSRSTTTLTHTFHGPAWTSFLQMPAKCDNPSHLRIVPGDPDKPDFIDISSMRAISNPAKLTSPFIWLHWGDGDFYALSDPRKASSIEGNNLAAECVKKDLMDVFFGEETPQMPQMNSTAHVIQALGAFFFCSLPELSHSMDNLATGHKLHRYAFYNEFYLPVGNATSDPSNSWVLAAKMAKRKIVLVGPKHLDTLTCMLEHVAYFEIRIPVGCGDVQRIRPKLVEFSRTHFADESLLFLVAGGSVGKIIAYQAFKELQDKDIFVDIGASLDGWSGRQSRDFNRDLKTFCWKQKEWMAYDACKSACNGIHKEISCKQCPSRKLESRLAS